MKLNRSLYETTNNFILELLVELESYEVDSDEFEYVLKMIASFRSYLKDLKEEMERVYE